MTRHDNRKRPLPKPTETPLTLEGWKDRHFPDMPQVAWEQLEDLIFMYGSSTILTNKEKE